MSNDQRPLKVETPASREVISASPETQTPEQQSRVETVESLPAIEGAATEQEPVAQPMVEETPPPSAPPVVAVTTSTPALDRLEKEIDSVLEEDLTDLYLAMPADKRAAFKHKGEEVRSKIRQLMDAATVNTKKIFSLIRDWLKMIPGVNRFFLEQEAKIKTDKILLISREEKNRTNDL